MTRLLSATLIALILAGFAIGANAQPPSELLRAEERLATAELTLRHLRAVLRVRTVERDRARSKLRREYVLRMKARRQLRLAVRNQPSIHRIIAVAATAYGQSYTMLLRKARCESGLWPYARNRSSGASGLFQFLPSTWDSTPFRRHSIFDPFAQALAASWMHSHLRGGEWVCR